MKYDSITVDAETVERSGFHFDAGLLAQLKQFVNGPTDVVISIVVASEILKHLIERTRLAKDAIEAAHKKAVDFGLKKHNDFVFAEPAPDVRAVAKSRLEKFFREIGAQILPVDDVPMRDVFQKYFTAAPPFAASGKKKNEFPDAVALLSVEVWANKNNKSVLAVSGDKDWAEYAENSERIDVVSDLSDALAVLQEHAEEAGEIVQKLLADMEAKRCEEMRTQFLGRLADAVSDYSYSVYAEVDSAYETEGGEIQLAMLDYTILGDDESYIFKVVRAGPKEIVARVDLEVKVRAEASFSLSIYDSIDKDYVGMGSADAEKEETFEATALVTFHGDFASNDVAISSVELVDGPSSIDFGTVDIDHSDDYYR
jgi:hypothetical protein